MNRRITCRTLQRKHNEFIQSIKDESVRELMRKNSFVTGGAITSLLETQKVNDYDYYVTNIETARAVAHYYCNEFNRLHPKTEIKPLARFDTKTKRVDIYIKSKGVVSESEAGGYRYFEQVEESQGATYVDDLVKTIDKADEQPVAEMLKEKGENYRPIFLSSNAITLSNSVQIVIRFYGSPEEVHKNYDYVHCTNYWLPETNPKIHGTGKLVLNAAALESLVTKNLQYTGSLYPLCSIIRMRKFIKRGWYINAGQILKMCMQLSDLDLTDLTVLQDQLTGVDAAYFNQIITYCKDRLEKDPDFKIDSMYVTSIIDKIFG